MRTFKLSFLICFSIFIAFTSCKKDKIEEPATTVVQQDPKDSTVVNVIPGPNNNAKPANLYLGANVTASFFIQINDEAGSPIENVNIVAGNKTASTDEYGIAFIENASVKEKLAYITATKSGYFLGSRSIIPHTTNINEIKIKMLQQNVVATINSGSPSSVSISSGLSIDFQGAFINEAGSEYNGPVNISLKHLATDSEDFSEIMPGSLYAQSGSNPAGGILESYGMAAISLKSPSGESLQIANGTEATIHMPIANNQLANAPTTIPLWSFDEVAGYWIEDGSATLTDGVYVGNVKHFSFWNCDDFYDRGRISGTISDAASNPVPYAKVEIITPNAQTTGNANYLGEFDTYVPANVNVIFNIYDNCNNLLTTWTNNFVLNDHVNQTFTVNAAQLQTIVGNLVDCNNNAISNGFIRLVMNNTTYYPYIANGNFTALVSNCATAAPFTIEGINLSNYQSTGIMGFNINGPSTQIGTIVACNNVAEYISYTIDNGTAITYITALGCYQSNDQTTGTPTGVDVNANNGNDYMSLHLEGIAPGTYNFMDNGTSTPGANLTLSSGIYTNAGYPNISFSLNEYGAVGTFVNISFSGTYQYPLNVWHTIMGNIHVLRDS